MCVRCVFSPGCLPFIVIDSRPQCTQCLRCASTAQHELTLNSFIGGLLVGCTCSCCWSILCAHACIAKCICCSVSLFCTGSKRAPNNAIKHMECSQCIKMQIHVRIVEQSQYINVRLLKHRMQTAMFYKRKERKKRMSDSKRWIERIQWFYMENASTFSPF